MGNERNPPDLSGTITAPVCVFRCTVTRIETTKSVAAATQKTDQKSRSQRPQRHFQALSARVLRRRSNRRRAALYYTAPRWREGANGMGDFRSVSPKGRGATAAQRSTASAASRIERLKSCSL